MPLTTNWSTEELLGRDSVSLTAEEALGELYIERQDQWISEFGILPESLVRVAHSARGYAQGWNRDWTAAHQSMVGKVLEVADPIFVDDSDKGEKINGIYLYESASLEIYFPYFVLTKVQ